MKKIYLLIILVCLPLLPVFATHIVGGEFELKNIGEYRYRLTLNLYFDNTGSPGAKDGSVTVDMFRKSDDFALDRFTLLLKNESLVEYTNPDCAVGQLSTNKIVYWEEFELHPEVYNDPGGYYVVWERCCRNNGINNIIDPGGTGQTFYLEFPPISVNSQPFVNSSPILFPPLSDYACINETFYFDFAGTDSDGDSLVYSMVNPLRGYSHGMDPIPTNSPGPYPLVTWAPGFSATTQITGPEPININPVTGLLRVIPDQLGLFVFAIKCDEYRNGIKIGEVRRDFQLLVLNCPTNEKPAIVAEHAITPGVTYQPGQVLQIEEGSSRCLNLTMTDLDPNEWLTVVAVPVNFTPPAGFTLNATGLINDIPGNDAMELQFCMPRCLPERSTPYLLDLIVKDDGCSVPKQDTIRISFNYNPPVNIPPGINTSLASNTITATVGDFIPFDVTGNDPDNGLVTVSAYGVGFDLASLGINFTPVTNLSPVTAPFGWEATCAAFFQSPFTINFVVQDTMCTGDKTDTISVNFNIEGVPNLLPQATANVTTAVIEVDSTLTFPVFATDPDLADPLTLTMEGNGFDPADLGMLFTNASGTTPLQGTFTWKPGCNALAPGEYELFFIARDFPCNNTQPDTHRVTIIIEYTNLPPSIAGLPAFSGEVGVPVTIPFSAHDPDNHTITVTTQPGINLTDYGIDFSPVTDIGEINSQLTWTPNCNTAGLPEDLKIWLIVTENACAPNQADSTELILHTIYNNQPPLLNLVQHENPQTPQPQEVEIEIGQELIFNVLGNDVDNDMLALVAIGEGFDISAAGIQFIPVSQAGEVQSTFSWIPTCENSGPGTYAIRFGLNEETCLPEDTSTIIIIRVIDPQPKEVFVPANVFTPNGDGLNDVFEFPGLPPDICADKFVQMQLFNRWGKVLYSSPSRNFKWDGGNAPEGIYFYHVEFERRQYKGWVSLIR